MAEYRKVYGLGAEFDSAAELMHAAEKIRDAGFKWDVHTPFPVHGMDKAMGLGNRGSRRRFLSAAATGLLTAVRLTASRRSRSIRHRARQAVRLAHAARLSSRSSSS